MHCCVEKGERDEDVWKTENVKDKDEKRLWRCECVSANKHISAPQRQYPGFSPVLAGVRKAKSGRGLFWNFLWGLGAYEGKFSLFLPVFRPSLQFSIYYRLDQTELISVLCRVYCEYVWWELCVWPISDQNNQRLRFKGLNSFRSVLVGKLF